MKRPIQIIVAVLFSFGYYLNASAQDDAGVTTIITPATGSTLFFNNSYTVTVNVKNYGTTTLTAIPLKFNVGNSTPLEETWMGTLAAGDSVNYTFTAQFVLTDTSISSAYCLADVNGDVNVFNNSYNPTYTFATATNAGIIRRAPERGISELYIHGGSLLNFKFQGGNKGLATNIFVVDMLGKKQRTYSLKSLAGGAAKLDISQLQRGVYVLVVQQDEITSTAKFIK